VTLCEYVDEPYIAENYRYIALPATEDGIILHPFVLTVTQYRRVTDRWTDRQKYSEATGVLGFEPLLVSRTT